MTRHLFRLLWNRRRHHALVMAEILCAFLVLFGVALFAVQYANNYRQPLGYDISRAWVVTVSVNEAGWGPRVPGAEAEVGSPRLERFRRVLAEVRNLPQVEAVAAGFTTPYSGASWGTGFRMNGRQIDHSVNEVTDTFPEVIGVRLVHGRWFDRQDDGMAWRPVVVNARLARTIFGETDVVGRAIRPDPEPSGERLPRGERAGAERDMRVVGVVEDFRQLGEFSTPENYMFRRLDLGSAQTPVPRTLMIRLRPGTTAAFEEPLLSSMRAVAADWSFDVRPLDALRRDMLRGYLAPIVAVGTIAAFMVIMVGLGLTGVVWQNVTQRLREIGLRRASGATRRGVYRQFLAETALQTGVALAIGLAIVAQAPLLPLPGDLQLISRPVFVTALVLAVGTINALTLAAAWFPSRLATRIEPAEALRYE
jgi:putative ABC transport system permease protein